MSSIPTNADIVLLGDLNVNFQVGRSSTQSNSKQNLVRLANTYHLEQLIVEPTRISESSSTLIDLLFVNNSHKIVDSGVIHLPISDHSIIVCVIKGGVKKGPSRIIEFRSYKRYCEDAFINELDEVNWHLIDDIPDIDTAVAAWSSMFTDVADRHAPIKKLRVKGCSTPWLMSDLSTAMRERDSYHRKAIRSNSPSMWKKFRKLKLSVNKQLRECKTNYFRDLIQKNSGNSAKLWKTLNEVTSRQRFSPLSCIESEGVVISPLSAQS